VSKMCNNHPDRPVRARGLCGPCYVVATRNGRLEPSEKRYVDALIEELEFMPRTWDQLEGDFGRTRQQMSAALYRRGRKDLIRSVQAKTYGVIGRSAINSTRRKGKPVTNTSYITRLIDYLEYRTDATWGDVSREFDGRTRNTLWKMLRLHRRKDLILRLNENSDVRAHHRYADEMFEFVEHTPNVTRRLLEQRYDRPWSTLYSAFYSHDRRDLLERVS